MKAGVLNEIIEIKSPSVSKDKYGNEVTTWNTSIKTRAGVYYKNGARTIENQEIVNTYTVEFTIRFYHNINETMRVCWDGKEYRILAINRQRERQRITIVGELINE